MPVPTQLLAGTTLSWTETAPVSADGSVVYGPADGWSLAYALRGPASIDLDAVADGDGYRVDVTALASGAWASGWYQWSAFVSKDAERYLTGTGNAQVLTVPGLSHARRMLSAIEAVLEGRATADVEEYTFDGRQLKKIPVAELLKLRDRYRAEVAREDRASAGRSGARIIRPGNLGRRF